eukprot:Amastigsp_a511257_23.p2 type:complete len:326 gc:universal Amastigsp_a511257_23:172-1149(+)
MQRPRREHHVVDRLERRGALVPSAHAPLEGERSLCDGAAGHGLAKPINESQRKLERLHLFSNRFAARARKRIGCERIGVAAEQRSDRLIWVAVEIPKQNERHLLRRRTCLLHVAEHARLGGPQKLHDLIDSRLGAGAATALKVTRCGKELALRRQVLQHRHNSARAREHVHQGKHLAPEAQRRLGEAMAAVFRRPHLGVHELVAHVAQKVPKVLLKGHKLGLLERNDVRVDGADDCLDKRQPMLPRLRLGGHPLLVAKPVVLAERVERRHGDRRRAVRLNVCDPACKGGRPPERRRDKSAPACPRRRVEDVDTRQLARRRDPKRH